MSKETTLPTYDLRAIPAGTFMMGAIPDDPNSNFFEHARHEVTLSKKIYVGQYLVTQDLWKAVMGNNPSKFKGDRHPVDSISWFDSVQFCNKLSELHELEPVYTIEKAAINYDVHCNWEAKGYRLLTEAEWEYCARGGQNDIFSGSDDPYEVAWFRFNTGRTTRPVGELKPNGFGLFDMSGNLEEWVWDYYREMTYHERLRSSEPIVDPRGPEHSRYRVTRGGSWFANPHFIRSSVRYHNVPDCRLNIIGLRLALANFGS